MQMHLPHFAIGEWVNRCLHNQRQRFVCAAERMTKIWYTDSVTTNQLGSGALPASAAQMRVHGSSLGLVQIDEALSRWIENTPGSERIDRCRPSCWLPAVALIGRRHNHREDGRALRRVDFGGRLFTDSRQCRICTGALEAR
jgi:hypothetical protein